MKRARTARPRPLGLLTQVDGRAPHGQQLFYPYAIGDRIAGDLTVVGHLATGRVGHLYQVWSATQWCAFTCKILSPKRRDDRTATAALRREGRILQRLRHPNLIRSFGSGEHDGLPFLLMEYLDGPSLYDILEQRPQRRLGTADAVRTAIHAGAGVYHLHRSGFLHLDLKPANLLLRDEVPVLVDFDTARRISPSRNPRQTLGTAPYMAPEQCRRETLGPAADVYGLGAILYELLTGRWPFEDVFTGVEKRQGEEKQHPQIGPEPPPPLRDFNEEVPPLLEEKVLRCLQPSPKERFPTMHALLCALVEELNGPAALWPEGVRTERRSAPRD